MSVTRSEPARPDLDAHSEPRPGRRRYGPLTWEAAAVAALVGVGVVLRFATTSPLWLDEALSVNIARLPLADIPDALRHDGHPPLYYLVLHGWMGVFGDGAFAVRALSGVASVAALPLGWFAARRAAGPVAGGAALALLAVSPFAIRYGTETRMYSLVVVLVLIGYLLVTDALAEPRRGRLLAIAVVAGLLLLTHYWAVWLVAAVAAVAGWRGARHPDAGARRAARQVAVAVASGVAFLVPWLPVLAYQSSRTGTPWAGPVRPTQIVASSLHDFGFPGVGSATWEATLVAIALGVLFLLGLAGRSIDAHRIEVDLRTVAQVRAEATVVALTIALGAAAGYVTGTTFATRYAAAVFPLFLIVVAAGASRFESRPARATAVGVVAVLCLVSAGFNVGAPRTQAEEIADAVSAGAGRDDVVVFCPDQLGPAVNRLLPGHLDQVVYPTLGGPERVDWVDYAERHRDAAPATFADDLLDRTPPGAAIWVVFSGSYRAVEGHCEQVIAEIGARRPGVAEAVAEDGEVFEHAALVRFPPGR